MSNAKGSDQNNKISQPVKVVAQSRSETNAAASQDLRAQVQKLVVMPAAAVRAALANSVVGAVAAKVAYDIQAISRYLSFLESGSVLDKATLKPIKAKADTARAGDSVNRAIGKAYRDILVLNEVVTRILSKKFTETQRAIDSKSATLSKPKSEIARGTDAAAKLVSKSIVQTYYSGRWTDPAELTYGLQSSDQEVVQGFPNRTVEGVTFSDIITRIVSFNRTPADIARGSDSDVIAVNKILPVPTFNSLATGDVLSWDGYSITAHENLFTPTKEDFSDAYWNSSNLTIRSVNELAPDGSYTATKFVYRTQYALIGRSNLSLLSGNYYTFSVYAKCDDTIRYIALVCAESSNSFANFRVDSAGPSYGGGINYSYTITPAANGFFRCSITFLATTTNHNPSIWLSGYNGSSFPVGDNYSMTLWGPKIELTTTISSYQPRGYSTLQSKNLITYTGEIPGAGWYLTGAIYSYFWTPPPTNPTTTNYSLYANKLIGQYLNGGRKSTYQYVILTAGIPYTFSVYLKQAGFQTATMWLDSGNAFVGGIYYPGSDYQINLTNGTRVSGISTATTVVDAGNGWYRCSVTATPSITSYVAVQIAIGDANGVGTPIGNGYDGIYLYGPQVEQGSVATAYRRNYYLPQVNNNQTAITDIGVGATFGTFSSNNSNFYPVVNPAGYITFNPTYQNYIYSQVTRNPTTPHESFSIAVAFRTSVASGAGLVHFTADTKKLFIGTDGILRFGVYTTTVRELPSISTVTDNKWHYAVGTYDSTTKTISLYLDGLKVSSRVLEAAVSSTSASWNVGYDYRYYNWTGQSPAGTWSYYSGDIAKTEAYSTALSATQVLTQYNLLANRLGLAQRSADPATMNDATAKSISRTMASFYNTSYTTDIFGDLTLGSSTANEDIAQQFPTTRPETLSLTDLDKLNFGKVTADIFRAGDLSTKLFTKKIIDLISAIHDIDLPYNDIKGRGDISSITESITKIKNFVRAYNDTSRATDAISKKNVTKGPRNDNARATDAIVRSTLFNRSYADSEHTADLFSKVVTFNRPKADVARGTDAVGKYYTKSPFNDTSKALDSAKRTISPKKTDTARGTDSFSRLASFNRSFSSTATSTHFVDVVSTTKSYIRTFVQTAKSQDSVSRAWVARRTKADTIGAVEVFTKVVTFRRLPADIARGTDVFARVISYNRTKADTVGVVQTFKRTFSKPKADTARSTDVITAKVFTKRLADVIRMADSLYVSGFTHPGTFPPVDQQRVRDVFRKVVTFVRNQSEIVRGTDTLGKSTGKVLGDFDYKVWSDFTDTSELLYAYDLLQNYTDFRTEYTKPIDSNSKAVSKVFNATTTYYRNSTWTDYNDLTFGQTAAVTNDDPAFVTTPAFDQDLFISFAAAYTDAVERATAADVFSKVLSAVRNKADTAAAPDTTGRSLQRSVGDNINRVFNDVAELFYSNEYYNEFGSNEGGFGATALIGNNNGINYTLTILDGGAGYSVGQFFSILIPNGQPAEFTVAGTNIQGGITSTSYPPTGTPPVVATVTQSSFWTDYTGDLTLGSSTANQEFVQTSAIVTNYTYPGSGTYNIGPPAKQKRSVVGQELLFTLIPRSDGDVTRSLDTVGKRIDKQARQYMPQGFWNDFAELSFATGFDQDLLQTLVTSQPETFNVLDVMSRVTLGPIKGVSDRARAAELAAKKLSKGTKADSAGAADTFPKTYSISAGQYANRIWRDYNEIADMSTTFSIFAEIPLVYEGKYELIQLPETFAKNFTKVLTFPFYTWRDFNELTFGTAVDEEITFTWEHTDYTEISRVMDDARRFIQPKKTDIALVPDPLGKLVSKPTVGDTVVNDSLTYNPEFINYFSLADESLRANYPDYKIDKVSILEALPKTFSKRILNPGPITGVQILTGYELTNFDETVLTYGYIGDAGNQTFPDVKFMVYDEDFYISEDLYTATPYGSDSAMASDIFSRRTTTLRTFAETIHVADYTLIQKNGGPYFTQIRNNIDVAKAQQIQSKEISKSAGDNQSYYSLWYDFAELDLSLELTQYLLRPSDSAVDIGHLADIRTNTFTKNAGKINDIWKSFDTDLFFNEDLVQIFDESYRTEIILLGETIGLKPNKALSESPRLQDSLGKFYDKTSVGDFNVTTDGVTYSPDYLAYYDYEEFLGAAYPNHKIDLVLLAESKPIKYNKAAGLTQYYKNVVNYNDELTSFDYTLNSFNEILLYDMPARSIYNKYLDSLVFEELEEQLRDSVRDDPITAVEDFLRVLTYRRTNSDIAKAVELATKALTKGTKNDTARAAETSTRNYTINAGKLFYIWSDFNELSFGGSPAIGDQDLLQQYPWNRVEYLTMVENFAKNLSRKASPDTARGSDSRTLQPTKGLSENPKAQDLPGKFVSIAQVGNSTSTFWLDLGEITTYDETLLTYGYMKTTKFDNVIYSDNRSLKYTINPGNYRARVWDDFGELDYNEITQNYIPYVTELILPTETLTKSLNKGRTELPRATDAGYARKFDSGAYVIDSSPYFASDYTSDGVTTSTF
jgi:hypothetical protein